MQCARQQFFQVLDDCNTGAAVSLRHRFAERRLFVECAIKHLFDGIGNDRHAVNVDDLQSAVRLMQVSTGLAQ